MIDLSVDIVEEKTVVNIELVKTPITFEVNISSAKGDKGDAGPAGGTVSVVAAVDTPAFVPVNSDGTLSDTSIVGKRNWCIGVSSIAALTGFPVIVQQVGLITNNEWSWNQGDIIFLNGSSLSNTPASTGFVQKIGKAISSNKIEVSISQAILI